MNLFDSCKMQDFIAPAIKYLSFVIPAKAGHAVKLLRYPGIPLDTGTSPV